MITVSAFIACSRNSAALGVYSTACYFLDVVRSDRLDLSFFVVVAMS